ncbi:hypothetical protein T36_0519 [Helicobacter cinaedi]|uniref:hypothetical protein n=1 Tax=Helicobacter cinaedi TaxID=213 RepID=UPI001F2E7275|nr:hypothetical protein [Helicobacter cinaedi]BDB64072.1 hypothetical protein T36_0519 [Helicobacter cinaedi]
MIKRSYKIRETQQKEQVKELFATLFHLNEQGISPEKVMSNFDFFIEETADKAKQDGNELIRVQIECISNFMKNQTGQEFVLLIQEMIALLFFAIRQTFDKKKATELINQTLNDIKNNALLIDKEYLKRTAEQDS